MSIRNMFMKEVSLPPVNVCVQNQITRKIKREGWGEDCQL